MTSIFQIKPTMLEIITDERDTTNDYYESQLEDIQKLLKDNDYVPEEERGVEFIGLKNSRYSFQVKSIQEAFDIIKLFSDNYVDDIHCVSEMRVEDNTKLVVVADRG